MAPVLMDAPPISVEELLALPKEIQSEWLTVLQTIWDRKFTGPVTVNCHLGVPKTITVPAPQIRLVTLKVMRKTNSS